MSASSTQLITAVQAGNNYEITATIKTFTSGGAVAVDKVLDEGTAISVWNRRHGKATSAKLIAIFISNLVNTYNVNRPLTPEQIAEISLDMAGELWWVRMEELGAFFEAMKRGRYGKIYERLDGPMIWECWEKYLDHRMEKVEERRARQTFIDPTITRKDEQTKAGGGLEKLGDAMKQLKESYKDHGSK